MTHSGMDQTKSIQNPSPKTLLSVRLTMVEALLKRLADPALPVKDARRLGVAVLRVPYIRIPRHTPTSPSRGRAKPASPPPDRAFIAQAERFNTALAAAKLKVQDLFVTLIADPATPAAERDRIALASLRCTFPADPALIISPAPSSTSPEAHTTPAPAPVTLNAVSVQKQAPLHPSPDLQFTPSPSSHLPSELRQSA